MFRTQLQMPDELYEQIKDLALHQECTMSEVIRRATEVYVQAHPIYTTPSWALPQLSIQVVAEPEDLRELANNP